MQGIRAVIFDLWGTLIIDDPVSAGRREAMRIDDTGKALAVRGFDYERADIEAAFLAAGTELARIHDSERDLSTHGRTVLYMRHLDEGIGDRLDDAAWDALDTAILTPALTHGPIIVPGAREALAEVRALGLPIGLISNAGITPGVVLRRVLDGFGLLEYLDVTVFSDEVELSKPSAAIFEHALGEFGLAPAEAAFVGDQPVLDVFGPRRAGMWSVQIGDIEHDEIVPHARIGALSELVGALRGLGLVGAVGGGKREAGGGNWEVGSPTLDNAG